MTHEYKEYIKNLTHVLNKIFKHFSISSSWPLIDPPINEPLSELTTSFFQTHQPHVKLILSSHGTCHTAQYEPALPRQNNINQMNWSHQRELYSCMYGATKGKHMVGFGSLMVSFTTVNPFLDLSRHFLSHSRLVLDFFSHCFMCNPDFPGGLASGGLWECLFRVSYPH